MLLDYGSAVFTVRRPTVRCAALHPKFSVASESRGVPAATWSTLIYGRDQTQAYSVEGILKTEYRSKPCTNYKWQGFSLYFVSQASNCRCGGPHKDIVAAEEAQKQLANRLFVQNFYERLYHHRCCRLWVCLILIRGLLQEACFLQM
jgi:hypothetical protein